MSDPGVVFIDWIDCGRNRTRDVIKSLPVGVVTDVRIFTADVPGTYAVHGLYCEALPSDYGFSCRFIKVGKLLIGIDCGDLNGWTAPSAITDVYDGWWSGLRSITGSCKHAKGIIQDTRFIERRIETFSKQYIGFPSGCVNRVVIFADVKVFEVEAQSVMERIVDIRVEFVTFITDIAERCW